MLKTRIIPTLLWKNMTLVKGVGFDSWRRVGTILPAVKVYNRRQVDELIVVDITATEENRELDFLTIKEFSCECFMPLTIGGGIKNISTIRKLLLNGADKVAINSACFNNPELVKEAADIFGNQCIVVSIDAKKIGNNFFCFKNSGKENTGIEVKQWAKKMELYGAGEILITSIEKDGTMTGYDLDLIKEITENVTIPVIASGGAGTFEDFYKALTIGKCDAVAAASMFHFTEQTPLEAKEFLASKGIYTRNSNIIN